MTDEQIQRANDRSIMSVLERSGYSPVRENDAKAWFMSPFRGESQPSFVVHKPRNFWEDWGEAEAYGSVIDLVRKMEGCGFIKAVEILTDSDVRITNVDHDKERKIKPNGIDVIDSRPLTNTFLQAYVQSRGIDPGLAALHCDEVDFRFSQYPLMVHTALGFKNNHGGYELRNEKHKVCNKPKSWTTIEAPGDKKAADVFEGFFDFLSHLQWHGWEHAVRDSWIMNGLVYSPFIVDETADYKYVNLFIDNGTAANRYIDEYFTDNKYRYMNRLIYPGFEDYNDFVKQLKLTTNGKR